MAIEIGVNADAEFLGDTGDFLGFARELGAVNVLNDQKWEILAQLRANNPDQWLGSRYVYDAGGAEGRWRDVLHDGKPQTPQRMFEVLSAGYRPELGAWVNFGNEPARGRSEDIEKNPLMADTIKRDVEFYCQTGEYLVKNKVKSVWFNIQAPELTPVTLPLYKPAFAMMQSYPDLLAMGIHQYGVFILRLMIGSGDWSKLVKWGELPKDYRPSSADMIANSANANIGRDYWIRGMLNAWGYDKVQLFNTEIGFDHLNNVEQQHILNAANGGVPVDGLDNVVNMFERYYPDQNPEVSAANEMTWLGDVLKSSAPCFYNWSIQGKWKRYSLHNRKIFRDAIVAYNRKVREDRKKEQPETEPTKPVEVIPPKVEPPIVVIPPAPRYTIAEMAEIIAAHELNPTGLMARLAVDAGLVKTA